MIKDDERRRKSLLERARGAVSKTSWWWATFLHVSRFLVAVPWLVMGVMLITANLFLNLWYNRWWAGGNVFLVLNTLYGIK